MKTVILCGGQGTRLKEETEYRPKPMVEIGGKPILWHIVKYYESFGYNDFIMCLGYKGNVIKEYFINYHEMNSDLIINIGGTKEINRIGSEEKDRFAVTLVNTGLNAMTGARVKKVYKYLESEDTFMVTYGDGLSNINLIDLLNFHKTHGKVATISAMRPESRYGILEIDSESNAVNKFAEKPRAKTWASAGFFVFNKKVFDYIENGDEEILERSPLERLAKDGQLIAYKHEGFFYAMDTYRDFLLLNEMWEKGDVPWKRW